MRRQRRSRRHNGSNNPVAVATMPVNLRPSFSIPVTVNVAASGTTTSVVPLPSSLTTRAWRVTSIQCTLAFSAAAATVVIQLLSNAPDGSSSVTAQSRVLVGAVGHQEVKMRNSRHVQHQVGNATDVASFITNGNVNIVGVVYVSVVGAFF